MAAFGVPPMLWLAARRSGHAAANALAWPAIGVLLVVLMLSYSRGALVALLAGLGLWLAIVPLRLRATVVLAAAVLGAAPVVAWAFSQDGLTTDRAPIAARVDAGHEFGALLVLMVSVLLAAGLAVHFAAAQRPPTPGARRIAGRSALAVLALVPVIGLIGLATAPGGVDGQVSKAWHQLTDPNARTPANTPDRLTATSSVRARYWAEALDVHATAPWIGTGAGAYATVRTRFRTDALAVRHAHGYVVQTLADLGWVGLALSLAAAAAWLVAALRATGLRRRDRGLPFDSERVGLLTLLAVVAVFAVHSAVDWTWFVPANAGVALLCAGWIVGRGPLRARLEGRVPARAGAVVAAREPARAAGRARDAAARPRRSPSCWPSRSRRRGARTSRCGPSTPATRRSTGSTRGSPRPPRRSRRSRPTATRCPPTRCSSWPRSSRRAGAPRRRRRRSSARSTCSRRTRRRGAGSGVCGCRS